MIPGCPGCTGQNESFHPFSFGSSPAVLFWGVFFKDVDEISKTVDGSSLVIQNRALNRFLVGGLFSNTSPLPCPRRLLHRATSCCGQQQKRQPIIRELQMMASSVGETAPLVPRKTPLTARPFVPARALQLANATVSSTTNRRTELSSSSILRHIF